jgi:hypothetical protein
MKGEKMSYSDYLYIFDWNGEWDKTVEAIKKTCDKMSYMDFKFVGGNYWDENAKGSDDGKHISKFIQDSFISNYDKEDNCFLCFCNHDGIDDNNVYGVFEVFTRILTKENPLTVLHKTEIKGLSDYLHRDGCSYKLENDEEDEFKITELLERSQINLLKSEIKEREDKIKEIKSSQSNKL